MSGRYVFDIETDGLLDETSLIHSLVLYDLDRSELHSFADQPGYRPIIDGLDLIRAADLVVGHNILTFDLPAIEKITGRDSGDANVFDTLVASRLIYTNLQDDDFRAAKRRKVNLFPASLVGSHSLEAWGYRLHEKKGDFGKTTDWKQWSQKMQTYCEQDVRVNVALYEKIIAEKYSDRALKLEHDFQQVIFMQECFGFNFDSAGAQTLYEQLKAKREELIASLQSVFPPVVEELKTPAYWEAGNGETTIVGETKTDACAQIRAQFGKVGKDWTFTPGPFKVRSHPFNPASRDEVARRLKEKGWTPTAFTETGKPQVDEETLKTADFPEAKLMLEFFLLEKRIGQIAEGSKAWIKLAKKGRIHGGVITNGAVTGRCTHRNPNVSQVPGVKSPYGRECRSLFRADEGFMLVGADASGLELRCLGHYLALWDGGAYGNEVVTGDIHSRNQALAGLPTRDNAKTFIYGLLYGAGDAKLGSIVGGNSDDGAKLRSRFMSGLPAYKSLVNEIKRRVKDRGYLTGLDGRRLHVRSAHSALNTLLQSAGALIVKLGTVLLYEACIERGWKWGEDFANVAHIHDEVQIQARPEIAQEIGNLAVESFAEAGRQFNFRVPISGTFSVGRSWAETH